MGEINYKPNKPRLDTHLAGRGMHGGNKPINRINQINRTTHTLSREGNVPLSIVLCTMCVYYVKYSLIRKKTNESFKYALSWTCKNQINLNNKPLNYGYWFKL